MSSKKNTTPKRAKNPLPPKVSRTVKATPDSLDPKADKAVDVELVAPPSPSDTVLGNDDDARHDDLELTGSNVLDFVKHYSDSSDGGRFYFRGEQLYSTRLVPSLLREHNLKRLFKAWKATDPTNLELSLLNRFKRYTWHTFHAESDFAGQHLSYIESLCVAQHNGLPTMLLDWSLNPFIALFFAARYPTRFIDRERGNLEPATVWVMKLKPPEDRINMTIHLEDKDGKNDADEMIKHHGDDSPLVVVPLSFTRRIDAQSGRFIYCRCMASDYKVNGRAKKRALRNWDKSPWLKIDRWVIPGDQRDDVLKQIRILGFHDGKMFPDLKGWANYLQAGHK